MTATVAGNKNTGTEVTGYTRTAGQYRDPQVANLIRDMYVDDLCQVSISGGLSERQTRVLTTAQENRLADMYAHGRNIDPSVLPRQILAQSRYAQVMSHGRALDRQARAVNRQARLRQMETKIQALRTAVMPPKPREVDTDGVAWKGRRVRKEDGTYEVVPVRDEPGTGGVTGGVRAWINNRRRQS